ncbi:conserved hypothetical protein [Vibrio owensii]|uniref:competence protein CoiA family protein n=1 Tax=Vibrio TaxID=662 RepID=UPI002893DFF2|nr:conserved hypothetical protein [Vibrio owensii]
MNYINSENKNSLWELDIKGIEWPILASDFLASYGSTPDEIRTVAIKRQIVLHNFEGLDFIQCGYCGLPVKYRARSAGGRAAFYHKYVPELEEINCPFHSEYKGEFTFSEVALHETQWHFRTKHFIAGALKELESINPNSIKVEKYIFSEQRQSSGKRRPDIYFEDVSGGRFAIELIQGWLDPETIHARDKFFRDEGISLIWLFSENWSDSIFYYVMYGSLFDFSPENINIDEFEQKIAGAQCNAFVFSEESKEQSLKSGQLYIDVHFPEFKLKHKELEVEMSYGSQLVTLNDLVFSNGKAAYAVDIQSKLTETRHNLLVQIQEKAQRESHGALKRVHSLIQTIQERSRLETLSEMDLTMYSDDIADCFEYILQDNDEREQLLDTVNQTIVLASNKIQQTREKAIRQSHAKELRGLRHQFKLVRRAINESNTIYELTVLKEHLVNINKDYESVILNALSSDVWGRYRNMLFMRVEEQISLQAKDVPKPRPLWRIMNDILSYSLDERVQLLEARSLKAKEVSQQYSAFIIHQSPEETRAFEEKLNKIKNDTLMVLMNTSWSPLLKEWTPQYSYQEVLKRAGLLLSIDAPSDFIAAEQDRVEELLTTFVSRLGAMILTCHEDIFVNFSKQVNHDALTKLVTLWVWLEENGFVFEQPEASDRAIELNKYLLCRGI